MSLWDRAISSKKYRREDLVNKAFMGGKGKTKFARDFHDIVFIAGTYVSPVWQKLNLFLIEIVRFLVSRHL